MTGHVIVPRLQCGCCAERRLWLYVHSSPFSWAGLRQASDKEGNGALSCLPRFLLPQWRGQLWSPPWKVKCTVLNKPSCLVLGVRSDQAQKHGLCWEGRVQWFGSGLLLATACPPSWSQSPFSVLLFLLSPGGPDRRLSEWKLLPRSPMTWVWF